MKGEVVDRADDSDHSPFGTPEGMGIDDGCSHNSVDIGDVVLDLVLIGYGQLALVKLSWKGVGSPHGDIVGRSVHSVRALAAWSRDTELALDKAGSGCNVLLRVAI